ncbi:MAG: hypothetical protein RLZZ243_1195, partial [Bacteroidota bacterium]
MGIYAPIKSNRMNQIGVPGSIMTIEIPAIKKSTPAIIANTNCWDFKNRVINTA